MKMTENWHKKFLAVFLGVLFVFVSAEISLRVFGQIHSTVNLPEKKKGAKVKIMAVGNSYTAGDGAPAGRGYPEQLEERLNEISKGCCNVINKGRGNVNTSHILEHLPLWMKQERPDIVFLMVGEPNHWNKYKFWEFVEKVSGKSVYSWQEMFRWSKVFRFFELMTNRDESWDALVDKNKSVVFKNVSTDDKIYLGYLWVGHLESGVIYDTFSLTTAEANEAIASLKQVWEKDHNHVAARLLAQIYFDQKKDYALFAHYMNQSIDADPSFNYYQWRVLRIREDHAKALLPKEFSLLQKKLLAKTTQETIALLERWYDKRDSFKFNSPAEKESVLVEISENNPSDMKVFEALCFSDVPLNVIFRAFERGVKLNPLTTATNLYGFMWDKLYQGSNEVLQGRYNQILGELSKKIVSFDIRKILKEKDLERRWIEKDLEDMIAIIQKYGAKVVIQTYPPYRRGNSRFADEVLRSWQTKSQRKDLVFMDVGKMLAHKFLNPVDGSSYYSTKFGDLDEHQGEKGYAEIAKLMIPYVLNEF